MILVDANLLIYAIDSDSPRHSEAKRCIEGLFSGTERIGLPWIVVLAFLRVTTNSRAVQRPITPEVAIEFLDSWLDRPNAELIGPGTNHWPILRNLLRSTGTAGNLTSDAHVAALALEHGCDIYSADHDFARFPGVRHVNPLQ